jgi:hypothetical protein
MMDSVSGVWMKAEPALLLNPASEDVLAASVSLTVCY